MAVLVAISIPIFSSQLEKSRDTTTLSNVRSAYAMAQAAWLTKDSDSANHVTVSVGSNQAAGTVKVGNVLAKGTQSGFASKEKELPGAASNGNTTTWTIGDMGGKAGTYTLTFTYSKDALKSVTAATS